jgi:hypothetical protein
VAAMKANSKMPAIPQEQKTRCATCQPREFLSLGIGLVPSCSIDLYTMKRQ